MNTKYALIIDDEPDIRELLEITLLRMGLETFTAANVAEAKEHLSKHDFDICLTDMNLPDGNGIDLVSYIQTHHAQLPVAMITAYGNVETAISALKAGAFDFISKPIDLAQLRNLVANAVALNSPDNERREEQQPSLIMGSAHSIKHLNAQIAKLSRSQAPVYISGESGAGKELVAKMIHQGSVRNENGAFVPVNCGAIPKDLVESEFFGHKKGSFSGAIEDKPGLFRAANGGTLFLDEVADLPLDIQVKLLRAIQEKKIRPVGEQSEIDVDVRILSATHKDLDELVEQGKFRQDLYYRINVIKLDVPALRDRQEDIPLLANHFLTNISAECGVNNVRFSSDAMEALSAYRFPGNVRELENQIERAFTLCENNTIQVSDLNLSEAAHNKSSMPKQQIEQTITDSHPHRIANDFLPSLNETHSVPGNVLRPRSPDQSLEDYLEVIERHEIEKALTETKWNRTAAAKLLGISFRALRYKLKKLDID